MIKHCLYKSSLIIQNIILHEQNGKFHVQYSVLHPLQIPFLEIKTMCEEAVTMVNLDFQ